MNKERVKLIVKNMELLVDALKQELNENEVFQESENVVPFEEDYDEVFTE
jgi:hypothetical protein